MKNLFILGGFFPVGSNLWIFALQGKRLKVNLKDSLGKGPKDWKNSRSPSGIEIFIQESAQQTKPKKGPKRKVHEFRPFLWILVCFSLGKQARFTLNFCSGMPPRKVHELTFLWFGLPGPLLIHVGLNISSEPPTKPLVLVGNSEGQDCDFQARLKFPRAIKIDNLKRVSAFSVLSLCGISWDPCFSGVRGTFRTFPASREQKRHIRKESHGRPGVPGHLDSRVSLSRQKGPFLSFSTVNNRKSLGHRPVDPCLSRRVSQGFFVILCAFFFPEYLVRIAYFELALVWLAAYGLRWPCKTGPKIWREVSREEKSVHDHHRKKIIWGTFLASKKNLPGQWWIRKPY